MSNSTAAAPSINIGTSPLYHKHSRLTPKQYDVGEETGLPQAKGLKIWGFEKNPNRPGNRVFDADFCFDRQVLREWVGWWVDGYERGSSDGLYLSGPTGSGKSSHTIQLALRFGIPLYVKGIHEEFEYYELIGHYAKIGGDTVYQYDVLPQAMGIEGFQGILLLNEINSATPGRLLSLHEVLDGEPLTIEANGGEVVEPMPGFRVIGTGNGSLAFGDPTHQYRGVQGQNLAFADRFEKVNVPYLSPETEARLIMSREPHLPQNVVEKMVEYANLVRQMHLGVSDKSNAVEVTFSTRTLRRWAAKLVRFRGGAKVEKDFNPYLYSLDLALLRDSSPTTQKALKEIAFEMFGDGAAA